MGGGKASIACCHLRGLGSYANVLYLPGVHFLEESVQMIRSVKDVTQWTDCKCERAYK